MIQTAADPWLAQIMSRPVYRLSGLLAVAEADKLDSALAIARDRRAFSYVRVPTHEVFTVQALESAGFRIVDTAVTLDMKLPSIRGESNTQVRFSKKKDEDAVSRLARNAFEYSRFHLDPLIPRSLADEIKAQWVANYFRGQRGDYMVVAEREGGIAGFLQLLKAPSDVLVIDLIAVARMHRGQGLAMNMMHFAANGCGPFANLRVGTQAANIGSLNLYRKFGFGITATSHVLHFHSSRD